MASQAILLVTWAGTINLAKSLIETSFLNYSRPIVVAINEIEAVTDEETLSWLIEHYRVLPIEGNRWEVGGLQAMFAFTDYDEWVLIQDTLEVKDTGIFDVMFDKYPDRSISFGPGWLCYLGKYRREVLSQFPLPVVLTKFDAFYQEHMLPRMYQIVCEQLEGVPLKVLFPEWGNSNPLNGVDYMFGRENIVLYNPFLIKRKSTGWANPKHSIRARIEHK